MRNVTYFRFFGFLFLFSFQVIADEFAHQTAVRVCSGRAGYPRLNRLCRGSWEK